MVRRLAVLVLLVLAAPSAAQAAEVSVTGGVLRYTAARRRGRNDVTFDRDRAHRHRAVTRDTTDDADVLTVGTGCAANVPGADVTCSA